MKLTTTTQVPVDGEMQGPDGRPQYAPAKATS